ncbi:hypothetical protein [Microcoleus sp. FACHB-68]|uniref:hypothetical protein n=1 Tax=Microcoleus sp. FACHB-68 TaxID=2692826 RepID=UPI001684D090|nr:hypothetical protein [Microcoleus sp. FACHB-68]MBD1937562.1 hypothetical protein [Microcoleus sp. FACHB-68]
MITPIPASLTDAGFFHLPISHSALPLRVCHRSSLSFLHVLAQVAPQCSRLINTLPAKRLTPDFLRFQSLPVRNL